MSISEFESDKEFFAQFLDDYFAECDEHIIAVRRDLLTLEAFVGQLQVDRSLIESLFRSFHTLKGISGMVSVHEAEVLAHHMESYLRALRNEEITLKPDGLDALVAGTRMLEAVIVARRANQPPPATAAVIAQLEAVIERPDSNGAALISSQSETTSIAREQSARALRFTFTPSQELSERGVNVGAIRERLRQHGEIVAASPRVTAEGGVVFDFTLVTSANESLVSSWLSDGLALVPSETLEQETSIREQRGQVEEVTRQGMPLAPSNIVRVDLSRLDALMHMVGEMVISRARLQENLRQIESSLPAVEFRSLQETTLALERQLRDLREGVMRVRLVPVGEVFDRMHFVARDLARQLQKQIRIEQSGKETEIDKLVVERMMEPLLHLVRNAASHGVEPAGERIAAGKPAEAMIAMRARTDGEMIVIEIEDDGRGIDLGRVTERARKAGITETGEIANQSALLDILCAPGFSTRDEADRVSGRGVGMTVVRSAVEELGGVLSLETEMGRGSRFTIELPLTLAIADALIVSVDEQTFAAPQASVREIIEIAPAEITRLENNEIISYRGGVLPLARLGRVFNLAEQTARASCVLVTGSGLNQTGIVVDRILGQREIVVRAMTDPLLQSPGIAGATELGDGRAVLILDLASLSRAAKKIDNKKPATAISKEETRDV